jgi:membrane-bound ClpP family serine protease
VIAGFGLVLLAKLYGLLFMRSKGVHALGDNLSGESGVVSDWADGKGFVSVRGESWRAVSKDQLARGDAVRVTKTNGLTLEVSGKRSN